MVGTHNGVGFDRAVFPWRGRMVCVTTRDPGRIGVRNMRTQRLTTSEVDSVVSRLKSMNTHSIKLAGPMWLSDPSRSPGFSGTGHKTLIVSGWLLLLLATCAGVGTWLIDPSSYIRRLRNRRGFEVTSIRK